MGKLCTIVDVVDMNKVLVDGPFEQTGVNRKVMSLRRLTLTDLTVKIPRQARVKTIKKAFAKEDVLAKWESSNWAKTMKAKQTRQGLNDFDRFKLMVARKQRSRIIKKKVAELRKQK